MEQAFAMLRNVSADENVRFHLKVARDNLSMDSFESITQNEPCLFYGGIRVSFVLKEEDEQHKWIIDMEEGVGDGVDREWFYLVSTTFTKELFNTCSDDPCRVYIKSDEDDSATPRVLCYYRFFGRFLALALMHRVNVPIKLDSSLFLPLVEQQISLKDIGDPDVRQSLQNLLSYEKNQFAEAIKGLFPTVDCSNKTKEECLDLCVQHKYVDSVSNQLKALSKGFSELLICQGSEGTKEFFGNFSVEEFNEVLYGSDKALSVENWKEKTEYEVGPTTSLFWEVVKEFSEEQRRDLLYFWTSMKNLPRDGFNGLAQNLSIEVLVSNEPRLPSAKTCTHQLELQVYDTKERLRKDLEYVLEYSTGFALA